MLFFAMGIESADNTILNNIKKRVNIDTIRKAIEIANKHGIQCQGYFIFGLPGETLESIEKTISFAKSVPLARAQFLILDIVPGSELWYKLDGKFKPDWSKDSFKEPEWIPDGLTRDILISAQKRAFRSFYLRPITFFRLARLVRLRQIKYLIQRLKEYHILNRRLS